MTSTTRQKHGLARGLVLLSVGTGALSISVHGSLLAPALPAALSAAVRRWLWRWQHDWLQNTQVLAACAVDSQHRREDQGDGRDQEQPETANQGG